MANSSLKIQNPNFKIQTRNYYKIIKKTLLGFGILFIGIYCIAGCGDLDSELASLTISPSSATIGINQSQLFAVSGKDSLGFIVEVSPTWSMSGGIGSVNSNGLFTAGSSSGEGTVVATSGEKSASASVTVTEKGWLEGRVESSFGHVPGIKVYLKEIPSLLDFSDGNARYSISNIPAGTYEARTGETDLYRVASEEVTIERGGTETWDIFLETQPGVPVVPTTTIPSF